jgi:hypothetical protein
VICLDEYFIAILGLIAISAILPIIKSILTARYEKIGIGCFLIANENDWISIEEIASISNTSIKKARTHVKEGIEKGIILGHIENDMFVRSRYRDPNEILMGWPDDEVL